MTIITVWFCDLGRSVTKSIAMWDHGHFGVGNGISLPTGSAQGTLACAHAIKDEIYELTSVSVFGH